MPGFVPMQMGMPPGVDDQPEAEIGEDERYYLEECSKMWDHTGPGYEHSDDAEQRDVLAECPNLRD